MTVEALWADICRNCAVWKGWVTLNANFRGKGASPTNDFWHQKSRVPGLSYGKKKLPKSPTAWVGCTNVTDRQTTDRQTTDGRLIAYSKRNVIRWRLLKIGHTYSVFCISQDRWCISVFDKEWRLCYFSCDIYRLRWKQLVAVHESRVFINLLGGGSDDYRAPHKIHLSSRPVFAGSGT